MEPTEVIEQLIDSKLLRILRLFIQEKDTDFYLKEISDRTKVPVASVFRIVNRLVLLGLVTRKKIRRFKLYTCSEDKSVRFLESFLMESRHILREFLVEAKEIPGVNMIILHGKEEKDRANILLIGEHIDSAKVKELVAQTHEKHHYTLSVLELTEQQFGQMAQMGLYAGEKRVMWRKG
ncbi:MAG: helix-turn-helix domain-containing protein [DPANN group archaeon]|nr:helix-turn-helix domain-containing protein [DPANN group archaeon]